MLAQSPIVPKKSCVGCHFLNKLVDRMTFDVSSKDRDAIRQRDFSWLGQYILACTFGVWDEGYASDKNQRHTVLVETDRHDYCFFWQHRPGMLLPAAKILQEREAHDKEASIDRKNALKGLWIAAVGLVIAAIGLIINLVITIAQLASSAPKPLP